MTLESRSPGAVLRRTFAVAEFVAAAFFLLWGADSAMSRQIGGDGIATETMHAFVPALILIGLALGHAGYAAWQGSSRWWTRQFTMLGVGLGVVVLTFIVELATV